jgi:hypothetical protein
MASFRFSGLLRILFLGAAAIVLPSPCCGQTTAAGPVTRSTDRGQLERWWADLEKHEPDSSRALLSFSDKPQETIAFLKEKLKPLSINPEQVRTLLAKLGSDDDSIWKPAFEELDYFDPRPAIDLETLMKDVTETPVRQRLVAILSGRPADSMEDMTIALRATGTPGSGDFNFFTVRNPNDKDSSSVSWWAEGKVSRLNSNAWGNAKPKWTRAVRAIILLEHIATPDAIAILRDMATGHPDAQPTKAARDSLTRLTASKH